DGDGATGDEPARAIAAWLVSARGVRIDVASPERASPCRVLIRAGLLEHVGPHLADLGWRGQVAVVGDAQTAARYEGDLLRSLASVGLSAVTLRVPAGERGKQLRIAAQLWASLASSRVGRDGGIIALGGGSVGDVAGFVAATYLRGIRLAQVGRSLGSGRAGDLGASLAAVTIAAEVKGGIVSQDPREAGLRELLNFGHTMGHAYEAASAYRVTHGEAVAVGMVYATALAERLALTAPTVRPELEDLLGRAALPTRARLPKGGWSF